MQHEYSSVIARADHGFGRPGKNSHALEQLAGLPKTRRSGPPKQGPGKARAAESLIKAIAHSLSPR